ncbi:MAG: hypothetical protein ACTSRU_12745 [Candidatus Hodarchaeales archaeon]
MVNFRELWISLKSKLRYLYVDPNSPEGLRMRADRMDENAIKAKTSDERLTCQVFSEILRTVADRNLSSHENRKIMNAVRSGEYSVEP